jgi:hypothetical protein
MTSIENKLDALADFQSQIDYLEIQKRKLLNEVQVPAEILTAQDEANKARQEVDSDLRKLQKDIYQQKDEELEKVRDPELPPEYAAALIEANERRQEIINEYNALIEARAHRANEQKAKIDADLQSKTRDVYAQLAQRKAEIEIEFDEKSSGAKDNIAKLTAEIKAEVVKVGKSVKGHFWQAVYSPGRTTWKTDLLDDVYFTLHKIEKLLIILIPEHEELVVLGIEVGGIIGNLEKARKVGDPSVSLRKI